MRLMYRVNMSKSKGNRVIFSDELEKHGADALRVTMSFAGPPEDDVDWADVSPTGSTKFLARAWRVSNDVPSQPGADFAAADRALRQLTHRTEHESAELVESLRFNAVAARL